VSAGSRAASAVATALLVAATACTSVLGVTGVPNGTCGGQTASDDCGSCLNVECCGVQLACANDGSCPQLVTCADACAQTTSGDALTSCLDSCASDYPSGVDDYDDYLGCLTTSCSKACSQ
jgi:hypothetical protein